MAIPITLTKLKRNRVATSKAMCSRLSTGKTSRAWMSWIRQSAPSRRLKKPDWVEMESLALKRTS